jgi:hypothetical protein
MILPGYSLPGVVLHHVLPAIVSQVLLVRPERRGVCANGPIQRLRIFRFQTKASLRLVNETTRVVTLFPHSVSDNQHCGQERQVPSLLAYLG